MRLKIIIIAIVCLSAFLRFYNLTINPPSLDWDEVSLGWNSYQMLKTGTDEYGKFLPINIRSFGDYKPAMYAYLSILPIYFLGLNELAVRFVSAFGGVVSVLCLFIIGLKIFKRKKLATLVMFVSAVNPWLIQFSRGAFEANLGLTFLLISITALLYFWRFFPGNLLYIIFATLSIYCYHANKIVAPISILMFFLFLFFKQKISLPKLFYLLLFFLFLLVPFVQSVFHGGGVARFENVKIETASVFINNLFSHFNFNFLFLNGDENLRHHVAGYGLFFLFEAIFIFCGVFELLKNFKHRLFFLTLFFLTLAPSSLATGAPHAIRSLLSLPFFLIILVFGFNFFVKNYFQKMIIIGLYFFFIFSYVNALFKQYPAESAASWQYGYKQVAKYLFAERNYNKYDKIIMTVSYDQPYIYMLFYSGNKFTDLKNNGSFSHGFAKFEFRKINWGKDSQIPNTLIIGTEAEIPNNQNLIKIIYFSNDQIAFKISKTD